MADKIDKALPNVVKGTVHVESPEETIVEETQNFKRLMRMAWKSLEMKMAARI